MDMSDPIYNTLTVSDYRESLISYMATLPEGEQFNELQDHFNSFCKEINQLETFYELPSYESPRSL